MNMTILKSLLVTTICIFSLVACNLESEEQASSSISDCPIIQNKLVWGEDTNDLEIINMLPSLEDFFEELLNRYNSNGSLKASITWEKPKENYYVFSVDIEDVAVHSVENIKFGVSLLQSEHVLITDLWKNDNTLYGNDKFLFMGWFHNNIYATAEQNFKLNPKNKADSSLKIKHGEYSATYNGNEVYIALEDGDEGIIDGKYRIKWKQVNSELELKIYEEGSLEFTEIKAKMISSSSFEFNGVIYNLIPVYHIQPDPYTDTSTEKQFFYLYGDGTGYILYDRKVINFIKWHQDGYKLIFDIYDENGGHNESYAKLLTKVDKRSLQGRHKTYGIFSWNGNIYRQYAFDRINYENLKKNMEK